MLEVVDLEVMYMNVILVLRGVSLQVPEAGIIAVLGGNGGGKSTTLKAISGLLKIEDAAVTHGKIVFDGMNIENKDPQEISRMGIIQVIEGKQVLGQLSVEENLKAGALLLKGKYPIKQDLEKIYSYFPRLKELRSRTSGYLSGGEQQMLVMGRALMAHPKLMLLDEPSMGLSPLATKMIFDVTSKLRKEENTAILLVEQNVRLALSIAEYGYIMENGRIVLDGPSERLKGHGDVQEFYLGLSANGRRKNYRDVKHYKRRKRWVA